MNLLNKRRLFEITAAALTGLGKIVLIDLLEQKLLFILIACLFWIGYVIWRYRKDTDILTYWGFTKNNFRQSFLRLLPLVLISILGFFLYGYFKNTLILNWHILPILLLYPLWGVIQQYLVVGLVAGNLQDQDKFRMPKWAIVIITAILFSIVHYPSGMLILGTFLLAIVYTIEYLRDRNLWVLGIYHGWLGCFYYFFVLQRDPFVETFGSLF